jgi:hypothetical protein
VNTRQKIAIAGLISGIVRTTRGLIGKADVGVFRRGDIVWELDLSEGIDFAIYLRGGFEPETLREYRRIVRTGFVVLDIGANIGSHTLPLGSWSDLRAASIRSSLLTTRLQSSERNLSLNPELSKRVCAFQAHARGPHGAEAQNHSIEVASGS